MQLVDLDLSDKNVRIGALNVLQGLSGVAIEDIKTAIASTIGAAQSISGEVKAFISKMLDDGMISTDEKKQLKRDLALITTEYPIVRGRALEAGVPEADAVMIAYDAAYTALNDYLYNELKVFDNMSTFTIVADRDEFLGKFTDYYSGRDALNAAITDGLLLEVLNAVAEDIDNVNQRIDDVRNGDVIDGAFARSKLEGALQAEIAQISTALFPNGFDRQNTFDLLTPRVVISEDMVDYLLGLIGDQEEMVEVRANEIRLVSAQADTDRNRITSLEIDLEGITQIVAELFPLQEGQVVNLTQITQNAEAIDLLATTGRYDPGTGEVDSFALAEMKLLADRFELFIGGSGEDFDAATWKVTQNQIGALVQNAIEMDDDLIANISQMVQSAESVQFQVGQLRSETIERIDDALLIAQSGMLITANEIQLGVQNLEDELQALILIEADRIDALVQDVEKNSASILSLKSEQIAAMVRGGGAEAYLSLSVTLPATIDAATRNQMITTLGADPVNEVYALTSGGFWYVKPDSTIVAQKTLKNGLRAAGLLGSQIALNADEILMGGKVRAENIDVDDLTAAEAFVVSLSSNEAFLNNLIVKKFHLDSDPESSADFEVFIDEVNGFLVRQGGKTLISARPGTGDAEFNGSSFRAGPLYVSRTAPSTLTKTIVSTDLFYTLYNFLRGNGIAENTTTKCSGLINNSTVSFIRLESISVYTAAGLVSEKTGYYKISSSEFYKSHVTYTRQAFTTITNKIMFLNSNQETILEISGSIVTPILWKKTFYLEEIRTDHGNVPVLAPDGQYQYYPYANVTIPENSVDNAVGCAGSVSFVAGTYTMSIENLPTSAYGLEATQLYRDGNGFLKVV